MPYTVATAAITGRVFIDSYTEEARARQDVRDLMAKIEIALDDTLLNLTPPRVLFASRPTIILADGTKYTKEVMYPKGTPENPMTREEFLSKFRWCAAFSAYKLSDDVIEKLIDRFAHLEKVEDIVAELIKPVTP